MPVGKYDPLFGGEPGAAERALKNMKRTYGPKKGEQVFYGVVAKRERGRGRRAPKKSGKPFVGKKKRTLAQRLLGGG